MKLILEKSANPAKLISVKLMTKAIRIGIIEKIINNNNAGEINKYGALLFFKFFPPSIFTYLLRSPLADLNRP